MWKFLFVAFKKFHNNYLLRASMQFPLGSGQLKFNLQGSTLSYRKQLVQKIKAIQLEPIGQD